MEQARGILMLVAAGVAFYRGWRIHTGRDALLAIVLGVLALGLAVWHLTRVRHA
ncbi:MAG: hypothetical protein ACLPH3_02370 [Terracidiphilus sp.]